MKDIHRILMLLAVSLLLGGLTNAFRSDRIGWIADPSKSTNPGENHALGKESLIKLIELKSAYRGGSATFVDARRPEEYERGHLAGAVNLPASAKTRYFAKAMALLPRETLIIIYCGGGECEESNEVFQFLIESEYSAENLRIFKPGWEVLGQDSEIVIETLDNQ